MNLGDRIKKYEAVTGRSATARMPLMIRVDGRAFHAFTRGMVKPFDQGLINAMVESAKYVAQDMQGFKAAYIQSDEATFCITDYDDIATMGWFDYDLFKVVSISASLMTAAFNASYRMEKRVALFDSRAFSVPVDDVVNAFLWRAKDWERNSLQMYARAFFSSKQLHGKKRADMHEMLHSVGRNWATDLPAQQRNGTFLIWTPDGIVERHDILPSYQSVVDAIDHLFRPVNQGLPENSQG